MGAAPFIIFQSFMSRSLRFLVGVISRVLAKIKLACRSEPGRFEVLDLFWSSRSNYFSLIVIGMARI